MSEQVAYRQRAGVRIGDPVHASGRTIHFVRTLDAREFRLGHAEALLLDEFASATSTLEVAVRTGLDERTVAAGCAALAGVGLLQGSAWSASGPPADEPATASARRVPRIEREGWSGRIVLADPGRPLARLVARSGRSGVWAASGVLVGLALASVVICIVNAAALTEALASVRSAPSTWIAIVLIGLAGTVIHEYGHASASVAAGGAASEFGIRWRGPFGAFYCRTDDIRVLRGRCRRAAIALAGPAFGLAAAAPSAVVWVVAGHPPAAAVITVALVASSAVNLLPFPPLDGYVALTHLCASAGLVGDGVAALRRRGSGTLAGLVYLTTAGLTGGAAAVGVVTLWWVTLERSWSGTAATLFLAAEALVVVAVVLVVRRRRRARRSGPSVARTLDNPAATAGGGRTS